MLLNNVFDSFVQKKKKKHFFGYNSVIASDLRYTLRTLSPPHGSCLMACKTQALKSIWPVYQMSEFYIANS